jgi:hypothetical protein
MRKRSVEDEKTDCAAFENIREEINNEWESVFTGTQWIVNRSCGKVIYYRNPLGGTILKDDFKVIETSSGEVLAVKDLSTQKIYLPEGGLINLQNGEVTYPVSGKKMGKIDNVLLTLLNRC